MGRPKNIEPSVDYSNPAFRHGYAARGNKRKSEYIIWSDMIQRCHNTKRPGYRYYGKRGISVHPEWRGTGGFVNFISHVGPRPTNCHTIERIDNNGNYEPGNVTWATREAQSVNKRNTCMVTIDGIMAPLKVWCDKLKIDESGYKSAHLRIKRGMDARQAISKSLHRVR